MGPCQCLSACCLLVLSVNQGPSTKGRRAVHRSRSAPWAARLSRAAAQHSFQSPEVAILPTILQVFPRIAHRATLSFLQNGNIMRHSDFRVIPAASGPLPGRPNGRRKFRPILTFRFRAMFFRLSLKGGLFPFRAGRRWHVSRWTQCGKRFMEDAVSEGSGTVIQKEAVQEFR